MFSKEITFTSTSSALISPRTDVNKPENCALCKNSHFHISNNHVSVSWSHNMQDLDKSLF